MSDASWLFSSLAFRVVFGLTIGAILGSFATMLAYRLPRRLSIVAPRSHCPTCKATLSARDLVPLFSWLSTHGRCRHCQTKIGVRYFWIELSCSLLCCLATAFLGLSAWLIAAYASIVTATVAVTMRLIKPT